MSLVSAAEYAQRRAGMMSLLPKDSTAIIYGRQTLWRIDGVPVDFHQFSDLVYLAGEGKPGGALAISHRKGGIYSTLFLPDREGDIEIWQGFRTPFDEGLQRSGVDEVVPFSKFDDWMRQNTGNAENIYCSFPPHQSPHKPFKPLKGVMDRLRVVKSKAEIELIKKACSITKQAMNDAIERARPEARESVIASTFERAVFEYGGTGLAFPVQCPSGINALCLHYTENNGILKDGDALLIDAGAEFEHYASDFSKTVPIGNVSIVRRDVISMVEDMKAKLVADVKCGQTRTLNGINEQWKNMATSCLRELGVKTDAKNFRRLCPHGVAHWVGLDVHDAGSVDGNEPLGAGHVIAIEPGFYFGPDSGCSNELAGFGVRAEETVIL